MRLGGPVFPQFKDPGQWIASLKRLGYRAAYCPVDSLKDANAIAAYAKAAADNDIVIAEVGAWSNPLSTDEATRKKAITFNQDRLALADAIGAKCCVNITGSRGTFWAGPHKDNFTAATFDLIVQTVRGIIDAVKPTRSFYALETMPNMYPDSADSYLDLIKAIDRKQCAAHLDPVNLIVSPRHYYSNAAIIRECFAKLGPYIRSCHAKDVAISDKAVSHLDEIRPGLGGLDYGVFIQEINKLNPDLPLMIEHLGNAEEYALAAEHIRGVAGKTPMA